MKNLLVLLLAAGLMGIPTTSQAQDSNEQNPELRKDMEDARRELAEAAQRVAELSRELGEGFAFHFRGDDVPFARRAILGLRIGETEKGGIEVLSVTPGGPADKAGLQAGDRIIKINDVDLKGAEQASRKLLDVLAEVDPGSSVALEYRRGDATQRASVVTEESAQVFRFLSDDALKIRPPRPPRAPAAPGFLSFLHGWGDMELVALSPDLGEYFGTEKGLLVVRAPKDEAIKLRDGDVIVAIGGREPQGVSQAIRILRTYAAGEKVRIDLVRKRKKVALDIEIPEPRTGMLGVPGLERIARALEEGA